MRQDPWNRPLPRELLLGGAKRFDPPPPDPTQNWVISTQTGATPTLTVKSSSQGRTGELILQAEYAEGKVGQFSSQEFALPPILDHMSWDWLEFHYQPLQDLEVAVINWVPDPRVICGIHRIENHSSQQQEIHLKLTCQGKMGGRGIRLSPETFQGWKILSSPANQPNLVLFLTGGTSLTVEVSNQLITTTVLEPAEMGEFRWILVYPSGSADPREYLKKVIKLDWKGEISRKKILLSSQLQIKTGHGDRDFCLAFSQRQAHLILNQIFLQLDKGKHSDFFLTPLQAWQLLLALAPWDSTNLENLLERTLKDQCEKTQSVPLAAELLRRAQEAGLNPDLLKKFLPPIQEKLTAWFSSQYDKDSDGIPEEPGEGFFPLGNYHMQPGEIRNKSTSGDDSLETPGLAALLHNEITQITERLKAIPDLPVIEELTERKGPLKDFLLDSWQSSEGRFQTRDYQSHLSQVGSKVSGPIQNGWHLFQFELPQPTRLQVVFQNPVPSRFPENLSVIFHGQDWQGGYRVEELSPQGILWAEQPGWGTTQSVFSRLDHCLVAGLERDQALEIKAPGSDRQDLSLFLPLWMEDLPLEKGERTSADSLAKSGLYWSDQGLKSYPMVENSPISLPLNLLVTQGLIKAGYTHLAGEIFMCWIDTAIKNIFQEGCLYSAWDAKTGTGAGKANQVESLLPIGLLLELLGVRFQGAQTLILEGRSPILFPVKLFYRGIEIKLAEDNTMISRPGGDQSTYSRETQAVIRL